jgi:hypothetical protein
MLQSLLLLNFTLWSIYNNYAYSFYIKAALFLKTHTIRNKRLHKTKKYEI